MISPSFKGSLPGMPCTTCAFGDMHNVFGKSYMPKKPGIPPWSRMNSSAFLSNSNGIAPGTKRGASMPNVLLTNCALARINSISSALLYLIMLLVSKGLVLSFLQVALHPLVLEALVQYRPIAPLQGYTPLHYCPRGNKVLQ